MITKTIYTTYSQENHDQILHAARTKRTALSATRDSRIGNDMPNARKSDYATHRKQTYADRIRR
jgi:hypothetical protein